MSEPASRVDPPHVADELTMLRAFLDYQRATFHWKTSGLSQEQLATLHPPTSLTLAGLLKHLALVEGWWFSVHLAGDRAPLEGDRALPPPFGDVDFDADPDWEFRTARDDDPAYLEELWQRAVAASDEAVAAVGDGADSVAARPHARTGETISLRWILLHMIEEYARHNGHADLIRERVDGLVGE